MKYYSTNNRELRASFKDAVIHSLPADNGLYYPETIPELDGSWVLDLKNHSKAEIGYEVAKRFVGDEIPRDRLFSIVEETVDFDLPLVQVNNQIHSLELYHGPTWAFKDMGARFLSRCMGYFTEQDNREINILVATSGDTGGAVAAGFHGVDGVKVTILFPKGKVSDVQQKQLTTWGGNIRALEVDGTFDDCQKLVKTAFLDKELSKQLNLSSANSINIARLVPQSFYYFFAFQQLASWEQVVVSVPSGNYGNLTAGLLAWRMGLPIRRFIAGSNANTIVPDYLQTGIYEPKLSIQTYANAMDVGAPSNFVRMLEIFGNDFRSLIDIISGFSLSDEEILEVMRICKREDDYMLDPHGSIGYQALIEMLEEKEQGIFLETAHPVKFLDVVEKALKEVPDYSEKIESLISKEEAFETITTAYDEFKATLV